MTTEHLETTTEEESAITSLSRLAKKWPKSLWIFANGQGLYVLKCNSDGSRMMDGDSIDSNAVVGCVNIPSDGGDW